MKEKLRRFFESDEHDATLLFESASLTEEELDEFVSSMSAGEIEEMLVEEYGEGLLGQEDDGLAEAANAEENNEAKAAATAAEEKMEEA